jgi:hypothetical protein
MAWTDIRFLRRGGTSAGSPYQAQANEFNEVLTSGGLPPYTDLARLNTGWSAMAVSAVAALVARPTTTAAVEIWNGNAAGGASLIIDRIFTHELVTSTTGLGGGAIIYAQVATAKTTAPSAAASVTVRGNSGKAYGGATIFAVGTTVVDCGWFPWGVHIKKESAGAVVPGGGTSVEVGGRLIVPPGSSLCIHVVSGYVADTFTSGASWYERQITIE